MKEEGAQGLEIQVEMDLFIVHTTRGQENVISAKEWLKEVK